MQPLRDAKLAFEREHIAKALNLCGLVIDAAEVLRRNRSALYQRAKGLGVELRSQRRRASSNRSLLPLDDAKRDFEWRQIEKALERCGGNISEAARRLKIHRSHVYRLAAKRGVELDRRQGGLWAMFKL